MAKTKKEETTLEAYKRLNPKGKETPLQAFVRSLRVAHEASTAVDYFDLASQDKESRKQFEKLCKKQKKAFKSLHAHCRDHKFKEIKVGLVVR